MYKTVYFFFFFLEAFDDVVEDSLSNLFRFFSNFFFLAASRARFPTILRYAFFCSLIFLICLVFRAINLRLRWKQGEEKEWMMGGRLC